jgi:hypothetical protein
MIPFFIDNPIIYLSYSTTDMISRHKSCTPLLVGGTSMLWSVEFVATLGEKNYNIVPEPLIRCSGRAIAEAVGP